MRRHRFTFALCLSFACSSAMADQILVPAGSTWKYRDDGMDLGTSWSGPSFDDTSWATGNAQLGYGDGDETSVVDYGPSSTDKYITTYYRAQFTAPSPGTIAALKLRLKRDDGAVVYLNGTEIRRDNLPTGPIVYTTRALAAVGGTDEQTFFETTISPNAMLPGTNALAVEIHQNDPTSSDTSFDFELVGLDSVLSRGPYLQQSTPTSMTVRWRTAVESVGRVRFGLEPGNLSSFADEATAKTDHVVTLEGLTPDTIYGYSVGDSGSVVSAEYTFRTSPPDGTSRASRIWVLGDSGTANANARAVRDAYIAYNGGNRTDLLLMLGDNAYNAGTDTEYQAAVFDMYPTVLRETPLWPTIGNHDTASSANPALTLPYFAMFTLPTLGEAGGSSSGTEKYYAFDYANVHFVCLDSMSSDRSATGPMATWLQDDLANTTQRWIVAFFHHPLYSKGSHDSDTAAESVAMRSNILPILEAGGVDLVLSGHSHAYERSYLINGHYGVSTTLTPEMLLDSGSGREEELGAYYKDAGGNRGEVVITAGSSGQASGGALNHPAMFLSLNNLGSLVIDVDGDRMDVGFLRETGLVQDHFTLKKEVLLPPPSGLVASTGDARVDLTWDAMPGASSYNVKRGTSNVGPFIVLATGLTSPEYADLTAPNGTQFYYTVSAVSAAGESANGVPVSAKPMAVPTNVTSVLGSAKVTLSWSPTTGATSYRVRRSLASGGPITLKSTTVPAFSAGGLINGVSYQFTVSAVYGTQESNPSVGLIAAPMAAPATLTAVGADGYVRLSWAGGGGAADFQILRSTASGGPYELAGTAATFSYDDAAVVNGTKYYYLVRSVNPTGVGLASVQVAATPNLTPGAPGVLGAIPGNAQVTLSWTAAPNATSYVLRRATVHGGPYTTVKSNVTALKVSDKLLTNGMTYFYVVVPMNGTVPGPASNEASATPIAPPPVPTALTATAFSSTRIDLAWEQVPGGEVGWRVEKSTNGTTFGSAATVPLGVPGVSLVGLSPNKTYWFRVRSYNAGGNSAYSNLATAQTLP